MKKQNKKAFTLVELLVVIAILAILATVSIVGYSAFTKRANQSNALVEGKQFYDVLYAETIVPVKYQKVTEDQKSDTYTLSLTDKGLTLSFVPFTGETDFTRTDVDFEDVVVELMGKDSFVKGASYGFNWDLEATGLVSGKNEFKPATKAYYFSANGYGVEIDLLTGDIKELGTENHAGLLTFNGENFN